jgi:hypothetical protein
LLEPHRLWVERPEVQTNGRALMRWLRRLSYVDDRMIPAELDEKVLLTAPMISAFPDKVFDEEGAEEAAALDLARRTVRRLRRGRVNGLVLMLPRFSDAYIAWGDKKMRAMMKIVGMAETIVQAMEQDMPNLDPEQLESLEELKDILPNLQELIDQVEERPAGLGLGQGQDQGQTQGLDPDRMRQQFWDEFDASVNPPDPESCAPSFEAAQRTLAEWYDILHDVQDGRQNHNPVPTEPLPFDQDGWMEIVQLLKGVKDIIKATQNAPDSDRSLDSWWDAWEDRCCAFSKDLVVPLFRDMSDKLQIMLA